MHKRFFLPLLITAFLLNVIAFTVYLSSKENFDIRKKAFEINIPSFVEKQNKDEPEYVKGEALVKLKTKNENKQFGLSLDKNAVSYTNLDEQNIPSVLKDLNKKYKLGKIEKIYKGTENPEKELVKIKEKYKKELQAGTRKINEQEFLKSNLSNSYRITFNEKIPVRQVLIELIKSPDIEFAEPNYILRTQFIPNDPYYQDSYPGNTTNRDPNWNPPYDYLWNLKRINMENTWNISSGSANIITAVIDTGIDYTHPELGSCTLEQVNNNLCSKVNPGFNFITGNNNPIDDHGHGTHVSGIINAELSNLLGIAGISPYSKIMPLKVLNRNGSGNISTIAEGIKYAADNNAKVINLSIGTGAPIPPPKIADDAIYYANSLGVSIVAAAGNGYQDTIEKGYWPANNQKVMAISAIKNDNNLAEFSNQGQKTFLSAPGTEIISLRAKDTSMCGEYCLIRQDYLRASGTSMATPHVAGVISLLLSVNPTYTTTEIENILINSAEDLGEPKFDESFGFGLLNAKEALEKKDISNPPKAIINKAEITKDKIVSLFGTVRGDGLLNYKVLYSNNRKDWQETGISGNTEINDNLISAWQIPVNINPNFIFLRLLVETNRNGMIKNSYYTKEISYDPSIKEGFPKLFETSDFPPIFSLSDINNDNKKEIIFLTNSNLFVLNSEGLILKGFPMPTNFSLIPPSIGKIDINIDGKQIVYGENNNGFTYNIMARDKNGNLLSGFPISLPFISIPANQPPVLSDIDCDGEDEIILFNFETPNSPTPYDSQSTFNYKVYAIEKNGTILNNFPVTFTDYSYQSLGFYNEFIRTDLLNQNNCSEIIFGSSSVGTPQKSRIAVINNTGLKNSFEIPEKITGAQAVLGDINNDNESEIIVQNEFNLEAYKKNGLKIFSYKLSNPEPAGIVLADFNKDNIPEILLFNRNKKIISIINGKGENLEGFPKDDSSFPYNNQSNLHVAFKGTVADLNNDSFQEISRDIDIKNMLGKISYTQTYNGKDLLEKINLSRYTNRGLYSLSEVDDLDSDGKLDLVNLAVSKLFQNKETTLSIYNLGINNNNLQWPQFLHDEKHTGTYKKVFPNQNSCNKKCKTNSDCQYGFLCGSICKPNEGRICPNINVCYNSKCPGDKTCLCKITPDLGY